MTQYKVDVIGEQAKEGIFTEIDDAWRYARELLENGKQVEFTPMAEVPVEAPEEGGGAPFSTEPQDTDDKDEPATDPKDADIDDDTDADADDEDADDGVDDDGLSGEEIDATGDNDDSQVI